MRTIFYSLAGDGFGHAARTQAIVEHLKDFEVHIFTWGDAWDFFHKLDYPHLHKIAGTPFGRNADKTISIWKTVKNFLYYCWKSRGSVRYVLEQAHKHKPDLFISDFEGIIPRVAHVLKKPLLSIDNQHKFSRTIDKDIPLGLRFHAFFMGVFAEWLCRKPDFAIVSTFYHSVVKKKFCNRTLLTNCFMRKSVEKIKPTNGDYVLVYYKSSVGPKMLEALATTKEKVIVFNCPPENRAVERFEYHAASSEEFIKALAGCKAVFCAAGNQLLGEAAFYGKPMFTIPEPNQPEQRINGYYVSRMNYGVSVSLDDFKAEMAVEFLNNLSKYSNKSHYNGVHVAIEQIRKYSMQVHDIVLTPDLETARVVALNDDADVVQVELFNGGITLWLPMHDLTPLTAALYEKHHENFKKKLKAMEDGVSHLQ